MPILCKADLNVANVDLFFSNPESFINLVLKPYSCFLSKGAAAYFFAALKYFESIGSISFSLSPNN